MYLEKREGKNGITYVVVERYRDPITGKSKSASVSFKQNTIRARRQAERELLEKIEAIFEELVQREALHQCRTKEHSIVRGCPACFLILKGVVISSHETNRFS